MSFEIPIPSQERESHFPSLDEVRDKIRDLARSRGLGNLQEIRVLARREDIYHYECVTSDKSGDDCLFIYKRRGIFPDSQSSSTVIEVTYYIGKLDTNIPCSGATLAEYDEETGRWLDK